MRRGHRPSQAPSNRPRFWGRHAVSAALATPARTVRRVWGTREALAAFGGFPSDLPDIWLADLLEETANQGPNRSLVVLDQVTDPHNVGAVLRSAAAFDALAIVTQDRHSPPESGTIARSASGALELVPWVRVVNLARALEEIAEAGFWRIGLAGEADTDLKEALGPERVALVLGAE